MLRVHSLESFGTHDGPGLRLVVFMPGCNYRCLYCHNPDMFDLTSGKSMTVKNIVDTAVKMVPYFGTKGGVTISGGEPTLQSPELIKLFKALHTKGIHTTLDTNGGINSETVRELYDHTDLVLLDVKHINPNRHRDLTGQTNLAALELAAYREKTGKAMWLRYVLVPGLTDDPEDVRAWAKHFQKYKTIERVEILPYHTLGVYKYEKLGLEYPLSGTLPPTDLVLERTRKIMNEYLSHVIIS